MEISKTKKCPILCMNERKYILESIRWVDKVVINTPFKADIMTLNLHECKFCVLVCDDIFNVKTKCCDGLLGHNRILRIPLQTQIISSSKIKERILSRQFKLNPEIEKSEIDSYLIRFAKRFQRELALPSKCHNVFYIAGKFEFLHPFLLKYLEDLKKETTFLIVGIYKDKDIKIHFNKLPFLNSEERSLSMMACKYVNWVVIDAPYIVPKRFVTCFMIKQIYYGDCDFNKSDRSLKYANVPKEIMNHTNPPRELSSDFILDRIRMQ
ncbi:hypothetical protein MXB_4338, partial [Myxobolus squamalis]